MTSSARVVQVLEQWLGNRVRLYIFLQGDKSLSIVAHMLNTVKHFDCLCRVKGGWIAEGKKPA